MGSGERWDAFDDLTRAIARAQDEALQRELAARAVAAAPGGDEAAAVIAAARKVEQMRAGLENRLVIGQACGLLMGWLDVDAERAMGYLRRRPQVENRKIIVLARELVRTRQRPRRVD